MKRQQLTEWSIFATLVLAGAAVRYAFRDLPNFAPVAALSLFAGFFFSSRLMALTVPLAVLGLSDMLIGAYDWRIMCLVYGSLMLPVALRGKVRHYFPVDARLGPATISSVGGLIGCTLLSSVMFYLITNFGCWFCYATYDKTWQGLAHCYLRALPFFRYTLYGDLTFAVSLFSIYAWVTSWSESPRLASVPQPSPE